jgi:hypothetical protein
MDKIKVDAVLTDLEMQLETANNPLGSYVSFVLLTSIHHFQNYMT